GLSQDRQTGASRKPQPMEESIRAFQALARLFEFSAEIAQQSQDPNKALSDCLDMLRVASALSYGGNTDDQYQGTVYICKGIDRIEAMGDSLTQQQSRRVIAVMDDLLKQTEPAEVVVRREAGEHVS